MSPDKVTLVIERNGEESDENGMPIKGTSSIYVMGDKHPAVVLGDSHDVIAMLEEGKKNDSTRSADLSR